MRRRSARPRMLINMAGFVASNHLKGDTILCHAAEVQARNPHQLVVDVRNAPELDKLGRIPGGPAYSPRRAARSSR